MYQSSQLSSPVYLSQTAGPGPLDRVQCYENIIRMWAGEDKKRFVLLEIGVYNAKLTRHLVKSFGPQIRKYIATDPYLGTIADPYLQGYWGGDAQNAQAAYEKVAAVCKQLDVELERKTSDEFFKTNFTKFDVIIVDGDHSYDQCMRDLISGMARLNAGGLLICDDYGNPDHPGVTKAVLNFDSKKGSNFDAYGCEFTYFVKNNRRFPYPLGLAYWRKI